MKTNVKLKKCVVCKSKFTPYSSLIKHCSPDCAIEILKIKQEKKYAKAATVYRKANKNKVSIKTEAQKAFNWYVRMRDYYSDCASCGRVWNTTDEWDAGHYRATGNANHMRFRLDNCYKQCKYCNSPKGLGGNYVEYRKRLVSRFGEGAILEIEHFQDVKPMSKHYLERVKKIFNKRAKHLTKLRNK